MEEKTAADRREAEGSLSFIQRGCENSQNSTMKEFRTLCSEFQVSRNGSKRDILRRLSRAVTKHSNTQEFAGTEEHYHMSSPRYEKTGSNHQKEEVDFHSWCPVYGWSSKLWSPKYSVPYYMNDPKRDQNFDNHPYVMGKGEGKCLQED